MRSAHRLTDHGRIGLPAMTGAAALGLFLTLLIPAGDASGAEAPAPAGAAAGRASGAAGAVAGLQEVSSFTVHFPAAPYRTANIGRAVELINGSVVPAGQTWSFNGTVGERTRENGFVDGIMINDGRYVKAPGGGVSSVATAMYNAAFFAGVDLVEHGAHSFYIERYPEGREATVAWGTLDLRWRNDSGHPLTVRAESTDTSVTITLLGTKKYDEVRATQGPRTNVTAPGVRRASGPDCEAQTPLEGFDVAVDRVFVRQDREVGRQTFRTHYTPRDEVVCAVDPTQSPSPASPSPTVVPASPTVVPASPSPSPSAG
ncbi:VanW family protein [Streptomyces sp. NPDC001373]|uniref:VanW family protein n=1 Tax=Streptomyces sp. NPDC001373 TaxID=3364565 RepID=UPI00368809C3